LIWPFVLRALSAAEREVALRSPHLPRQAVVQHAVDELESGRAKRALALLEPLYSEPIRHDDDLAAYGLDRLCDAYETRGQVGRRRKVDLLQRIVSTSPRSALRAAAHQRLACIHMDDGRPDDAWHAFREAQRDEPGNPALGALEVQLLMSEGHERQARDRARFFLEQMRRKGSEHVDPETLEFYQQLATDPDRALSDVVIASGDGTGRRLADWLDRAVGRPLPRYRVAAEPSARPRRSRPTKRRGNVPSTEGTPRPDAPARVMEGMLEHARELDAVEGGWARVFQSASLLFIDHRLDMAFYPWDPEVEDVWSSYLDSHPEAFDSLLVLDCLVDAVVVHPELNQSFMRARLLRPLIERGMAILDSAVADCREMCLPWAFPENRPALRLLYRAHESVASAGDFVRARELAELMLRLNPDDEQGMRHWLSNLLLRSGDAEACLRLVSRYPDDIAPEMLFNSALAHYKLGNARSAGETLVAANRSTPRITRFVLSKRVAKPTLHELGVTLDGDDRGWVYREAMRDAWVATPGSLEWAAKLLRK
jgi:tetratricopeptide (TPR) repeat protein